MIYPAEIINVDYNNHTCQVNIPDLTGVNDSPNASGQMAHILETPGMSNAYKNGDIVWVSFIKGAKQYPIVLGFVNAQATCDGALISKTLEVSGNAKIPRDTMIRGAENDYNSFTKIINKLKAVTNFMESTTNLNSSDTPTTPSNTGTTEGYDHSLLEAALFSTITMSQSYDDLDQEYPLGRVLFVQNDAGIKYTLWSDIKIYPVASLATDMAEFSNSQLNKNFTALPGIWKVKTILNGAVLAQRCQPNYTEIPEAVSVMVSDNQARNCPLRDPDTLEPLCYYWEQDSDVNQNSTYRKHQKLMSIATNKLLFKDSNGKDVLKNNSTNITSISLPDGTLLKTINNSDTPVDSIAVLNLRDINLCTPAGQYCAFNAHLGNGLFCFSQTLEYIYLNDHYNNNVLNNYLFNQATALKEIYIPASITKIGENVFNGTINLTSVLNMENSLISEFSKGAFQNTSVETLYLPKTVDCVTFNLKSLGNHYNNNNEKSGHTKTLFVNSKLVLTSDYSGDYPQSCFYNYSGTNDSMIYINQFTLELVYSKTKEEVKQLIAESDIVAFFRTWYNQELTDLADLKDGLDAYMVDGSTGYSLGSATDDHPVIVYNYKR